MSRDVRLVLRGDRCFMPMRNIVFALLKYAMLILLEEYGATFKSGEYCLVLYSNKKNHVYLSPAGAEAVELMLNMSCCEFCEIIYSKRVFSQTEFIVNILR